MSTLATAGKKLQFWMLLTVASLALVHVKLTWSIDDSNLLFSSLVFWPAAIVLAQEVSKRRANVSMWMRLSGVLLLAATLFEGVSRRGDFLYLYPFLAGLGVVIVFFGFHGIGHYWKSLLALFALGAFEVVLFSTVNPAPLTARFSDILLWYAGYDVLRDGIWLHLPGGSVEVVQSCSGLRAMTRLFSMSLLAILCLPRHWSGQQITLLLFISIALGFCSNAIRVALLAILNASGHPVAFDSLHGGNTSQLFSIASVLLLMMVIWWMIYQPFNRSPNKFDNL